MQLVKGQKTDITKGRRLANLSLSLGWSATNSTIGIDAAAFLLSAQNVCERDENFIFYGNPLSLNGAVAHSAAAAGDKEKITISLSGVPADIAKIALTMTLYEGEKQGHSMKEVAAAYLRVVNADTGEELYRFDYGSDLSKETAIVVGELYRYGEDWRFSAIGSGFMEVWRLCAPIMVLRLRNQRRRLRLLPQPRQWRRMFSPQLICVRKSFSSPWKRSN